MNVTVREQTEKMQSRGVILYVCNKLLPCCRCEHLARLDRIGHQLCTLRENLTCTQRVVTNLGVTHIVIRGQTDGSTVCLERNGWVICHQHIQSGSISACNGVCNSVGSDTDTVHNDSQYRTLDAGKSGESVKFV